MFPREISANKLIPAVAEELKKVEAIQPHPLSDKVRSGVNAERPPAQPDFWYLRSAAILRRFYMNGKPIGVEKFRTMFGGKRRRGHKPAHRRPAGGKFIRLMIQQLETSGFISKVEGKAGRVLAPAGQKLLDNVSKNLGE